MPAPEYSLEFATKAARFQKGFLYSAGVRRELVTREKRDRCLQHFVSTLLSYFTSFRIRSGMEARIEKSVLSPSMQ